MNKKGVKIFKYRDIKLNYFEQQKASLANNAKAYIDMTLEAIYECFGGLSEDDPEGTPTAGDKFLYDICCILNSRKWIWPESLPPTVDNTKLYFEKKNLLSLERVFTVYSPSINKFAAHNEYMSILNFCLQQLQVHLHASYKLWQFLFPIKEMRDWCNIFTILSFVSALHAQMWNLRDSSAKCRLQKLTGTILHPK